MTTKYRLFTALLLIAILWLISDVVLPYFNKKKADATIQALNKEISEKLSAKFTEFVRDTIQGNPIGLAIDIVGLDSSSNQAQIARQWAKSRGVNVDNLLRTQYEAVERKVKIQAQMAALETSSNDDFSTRAFIMGKQLVKNEFGDLRDINFSSDYTWRKTLSGYYHITSKVRAENNFGVRMFYKWEIELRLKSGDWTNIDNWEHNELHITSDE